MNTIAGVVALVVAARLLFKALEWWHEGAIYRDISQPAVLARKLAELQERLDDALANLAELQTPGWYDLAWPICDSLDLSSDGEYCRRCFRQANEHARLVAQTPELLPQDRG